jgi:hypothetical protein
LHATGPISKCLCPCKGATHGLVAEHQHVVAAKCTPSVEKRCKAGNENGECSCACGGINHGLYKEIVDFEKVKITGLALN